VRRQVFHVVTCDFVPLDVSFNDTFSKTEKKTIFSNDLDIGEKICGDLIVDVPSEGFTIPQIVKMGLKFWTMNCLM
jgi:hypothetical protein